MLTRLEADVGGSAGLLAVTTGFPEGKEDPRCRGATDALGLGSLRAEIVPVAAVDLGRATPWRVWLDADAVGEGWRLRPWQAGDRLQPLGLDGIKKVHDLLIDAKVPRPARAEVQVLETARGIAWVVGIRIAEWAKVTPATRRAWRLEWAAAGRDGRPVGDRDGGQIMNAGWERA